MRTRTALALLLLLPACGDDSTGGDDGATPTTSDGTTEDDGPTIMTDDGPGDTTAGDGPSTTDDDGPATTDDGGTTEDDGPADTGSTDSTTGGMADQLPPTNGAELLPWLESEVYTSWTSESAPHPSTGPHFDGVWTFVNDALFDSLEAGNPTHPEGSAAVKELFNAGGARLGWAVEVKIQADSAGGDGWYWYEIFDGNEFADGTGEDICTGCHGGGGTDFVLTPFPLQ